MVSRGGTCALPYGNEGASSPCVNVSPPSLHDEWGDRGASLMVARVRRVQEVMGEGLEAELVRFVEQIADALALPVEELVSGD